MNPSSRVLRPLLNRRVTAAHRGTRPKPLVQAISVLLAAAAAVSESRAADGTWMQLNFGDASGMWSDPAAWAGGVIANGPGFTANFATLDATLPGTIVLDAPRTIGNVLFGDTDPSTPANWTLSNNFDVANVLTLSGPAPTITANAAPGSTLTLNTVLAGTEGVTFAGNNTILSAGNPGHTYTGGTVLKTRVETTNVANAPLTIFGAALATNTLTFDGGYFKIFNTTAATSAGTLVNNLIVNTTGTLEYSGRSSTTGTLTGSGVLNVITHYVRSDNGGNWSGFTGTINVTSGDAGTSDFRQTTYNGFAGATVNLNTNSFLTFTLNQANTTNPLTGTVVDIGALSGVSSAILRGGAQNGRVTSFRIGAKNLDTTFAGAIETDTAVNRLSNVIKNGTGTLTLTGDRSAYNGPTFINDGTLAVAVLANGGSVSSIGRAPNTPDNLVINGGTFRYIGGGSSTDRLFTLGTNNPSLDASGSGPVNFTNPGGIALSGFDAARTITFTGTNSGGNSLAATLGDNGGGITSVTKSGPGTWALNGSNTYSGATTITGGVLSVSSLGNGGTASGIGQSGSAASSLVIDGGTIRYTGAVTSTDRAISVGTAGATLDASGTGAITFINPAGIELVGLDAARTLTLTGISTADNVLSAALPNNGAGATSLIKNGPGTWALTSANTYSGGTTINGGTLRANNTAGSATGSGSVIVNNTGAIGGFGNVSGAVTLNDGGHIAPGDGVGMLTLGSLTLSMGSVLDFEFNGTPANDRVTLSTLNGLTINGGGFNLFTEGSTNKWTAPGTYNLVQFTGGVGGTGPGALSVLNPQPGLNYAFAADSGFLRLVISATARLSNWILTTGGSWADAANWSNGIPNAQNDGANFTAGLSAPGTITLDGSKTVGTIQLNNPSAYTIAQGAGGSLILDSGGNAAAITVLNGSHTISAPVTLTSNTSVEVTTSTDMLTISGSISGNGTLAKTGAGTLALSGANLFPNGTTIHGGTVQIGSNGALGTGALAFASSGTLRAGADGLAATNSISVANAVTAVIDTVANTFQLRGVISNPTGSGALTKIGTGTLVLGDANTYSGVTSVNAGILSVSTLADGGLPSSVGSSASDATNLTLNGGTLRYTGTAASTNRLFGVGTNGGTVEASGTGPLAFTSAGSIAFPGTDLPRTFTLAGTNTDANSFAPVISDNGSGATSLVKAGPGTWQLAGANTFTGTTVITGGTLALANPLALNRSTLDYNNQGGTLSFDLLGNATLGALTGSQRLVLDNAFGGAVALTVGAANTNSIYAGSLSGFGSVTKVGSGMLSLSGQNSFAGTTTIVAGGGILKLLVTDALRPGSQLTINNPFGLHLGDGVTLSSNITAAVGSNEFLDVPDAGAVATYAGNAGIGGGANQFRLGVSGANATLNVTGSMNIPNANSIAIVTRGNVVFGGASQFNAAPGVLIGRSAQALNLVFKDDSVANLGAGTNLGGGQPNPSITLTIQDNAAVTVGSLDLNSSSAGTNQTVLNLNGGTLTTGGFFKTNIGGSQLSTINFNGGTLIASATNEAFLPALTGLTANVQAGGARIDTSFSDLTLAQPFAHDPALEATDGGLRKLGEGVLTLSGDSTYAGPTLIELGKLVVTGSLSGTTRVTVTGAALELGAADRLNDLATFHLGAGSTFSTSGFGDTLGAFTLGGAATIDLGAGASILRFADSSSSSWNAGTLTIAGWTGSTSGGAGDQLFFGSAASGLTPGQLAQVRFSDPAGFAPGFYGAQLLNTGELVAAIPEPTSAALLLAGVTGLLARRRRGS